MYRKWRGAPVRLSVDFVIFVLPVSGDYKIELQALGESEKMCLFRPCICRSDLGFLSDRLFYQTFEPTDVFTRCLREVIFSPGLA